jgi:hypothetical protein
MTAIFCDSPFQMMCALNIAQNYLQEDGCVLFPMREMFDSKKLFLVGKENSFIRQVCYVRRTPKKMWRPIRKLLYLWCKFSNRDFQSVYGLQTEFYDLPSSEISFTSVICDLHGVDAIYLLKSKKQKCPFYIIEEGIGEYFTPPEENGIFCNPSFSDVHTRIEKMYFWPELFERQFPNFFAKAAPKISFKNEKYIQCIDAAFKTSNVALPTMQCVYFHQPINRIEMNNKDEKIIARAQERELVILHMLKKKYGDKFYIKLHPRDSASGFDEFQVLPSQAPWESIIPHLPDVSQMLFVGINSTAMITPKMMFDLEPNVLCLESLLDCDAIAGFPNDILAVFEYMKKVYRDPSKVHIAKPNESLDELIGL